MIEFQVNKGSKGLLREKEYLYGIKIQKLVNYSLYIFRPGINLKSFILYVNKGKS
jgi:hypothetical protein